MRKYFDQITTIAGNVVTVSAAGVGYDELAVVTTPRGTSLAQVIRLEGDQVTLQVFAGTQGVSTGDRVRFLGHPMQVPFTDELLGRIFDGSGRPRDGAARDRRPHDRDRRPGGQPRSGAGCRTR